MAIDGVSAVGSIGKSLDVGATDAGTVATSSTQGPSFMDMLGQVVSDGIGTMQAGESAAIQGLQGAMQPYKVVDAIMGAQRTLLLGPGDPRQGGLRLPGNLTYGDLKSSVTREVEA